MHEEIENGKTPAKKPFIFYAIIAMIIIMLLNALVFPSMLKRTVVEVGYDQFLEMIDDGQVKEVSYDEYSGQVVFIAEKDGKEAICKTGIWPDDGQRLLQQLTEQDVHFASTIPTQADPLLSFIVSWILPMVFFFLVGDLFYRWMRRRMQNQIPGGMGNAMSFGKSGAKVYVADAKTGVKFKDVAG